MSKNNSQDKVDNFVDAPPQTELTEKNLRNLLKQVAKRDLNVDKDFKIDDVLFREAFSEFVPRQIDINNLKKGRLLVVVCALANNCTKIMYPLLDLSRDGVLENLLDLLKETSYFYKLYSIDIEVLEAILWAGKRLYIKKELIYKVPVSEYVSLYSDECIMCYGNKGRLCQYQYRICVDIISCYMSIFGNFAINLG